MAKDPACGMECDPRTSDKVEGQGEAFCFCSPGCKQEFERGPRGTFTIRVFITAPMGSTAAQTAAARGNPELIPEFGEGPGGQ